jgi:hypothetical protein
MFVDLPRTWTETLNAGVRAYLQRHDLMPQRISAGVYWAPPAFSSEISDLIASHYSFAAEQDAYWTSGEIDYVEMDQVRSLPSDFGICHQVQQVRDYYAHLTNDPRPFVIFITAHEASAARTEADFLLGSGPLIADPASDLHRINDREHYLAFHLVRLHEYVVAT